jgi:hypothetical protein
MFAPATLRVVLLLPRRVVVLPVREKAVDEQEEVE